MYPFSFQKGNKAAGCEDAPPVATAGYSVVCDGLGGAGSTKHTVLDDETRQTVTRTSGYLGSRIVCDCVRAFFEDNAAKLETSVAANDGTTGRTAAITGFVGGLKTRITQTLAEHLQKWDIKPTLSKTLKDFPTTLASAIYFKRPKGTTVLSVWAGDSRVYALTPGKGLQLLSLDDAKGAEDEMNSASEMTNCISAGNIFRLNYALYDLNEPGLVFCCSDGCFDYLKSPLHFEWLLLHTMLECMLGFDAANIGNVLADSIRDNVYGTIGDDTTMAGVIVGIESEAQMKSLFQERKAELEKQAVTMNGYLAELKKIQTDRDSARKKCSLTEEKVLPYIQEEVCRALRGDSSGSSLRAKLTSMPCYIDDYAKRVLIIEEDVEKLYEAELKKAEELSVRERNVCRDMLMLDHFKSQRDKKYRAQNYYAQFDTECAKPEDVRQMISACIAMMEHPYFKEIPIPSVPDDKRDQYLRDLKFHLEKLYTIMGNREPFFKDLWNQAYFSTDYYAARLRPYSEGEDFLSEVIDNPWPYPPYVSALTKRKIAEYHDQASRNNAIRDKVLREKQRRMANLPEEFWMDHKDEIFDMIVSEILSESKFGSRKLFPNSAAHAQFKNLLAYAESKQVLQDSLSKTEDVQKSIDGIWEQYRQDYQLILQISEKGAC